MVSLKSTLTVMRGYQVPIVPDIYCFMAFILFKKRKSEYSQLQILEAQGVEVD